MTTPITLGLIRRVLSLELGPNDADEPTVCDYLLRLLHDVIVQGEGFDGKRPFGNSGWQHDLYASMVRAEIIEGEFDEDGYVEELDDEKGEEIILACIAALDVDEY
jgi:hypothetical protein